jgi:putative Mg2+ transporter-C (MgtC) family protein
LDLDVFVFNYLLKIALAACCGALIGLERELSGKPAGLRTTILICVGSCLFLMLSYEMAWHKSGTLLGDPSRIAAQIVTGIGFLGAGAIIQSRGNVVGLTTAATIWVTASVGMAVGLGFYPLALATTLFILFILLGLRKVDIWLDNTVRQPYFVEIKIEPQAAILKDILLHVKEKEGQIGELAIDKSPDYYKIHFTLLAISKEKDDFQRFFFSHKGVSAMKLEKSGR